MPVVCAEFAISTCPSVPIGWRVVAAPRTIRSPLVVNGSANPVAGVCHDAAATSRSDDLSRRRGTRDRYTVDLGNRGRVAVGTARSPANFTGTRIPRQLPPLGRSVQNKILGDTRSVGSVIHAVARTAASPTRLSVRLALRSPPPVTELAPSQSYLSWLWSQALVRSADQLCHRGLGQA